MAAFTHKIVSGGQTGADRGGLDAAIELGIAHGGFCPKGRRAEDGAIPPRYELAETATSDYAERTEKNVASSDGTVVFTFGEPQGGSRLTVSIARRLERPLLAIDLLSTDDGEAARALRAWASSHAVRTLNVAGSRESQAPGIGERVRAIVVRALE
jgi:hypothetical protein